MIISAFNIEWEKNPVPFEEKEIEIPERIFNNCKTEEEEDKVIGEYIAEQLDFATDFFNKVVTFEWDICG